MQEEMYIVYVKTNEDGFIVDVNSSEFIKDTTGWVEIDRGYGEKYHHAQGNYFPIPFETYDGTYNYKLVDRNPVPVFEEV